MVIGAETARPARSIAPVQYPDNDREFIIDGLFGSLRADTDHWTCNAEDGADGLQLVHGYTPLVMWRATRSGSSISLRGRIEADLAGRDRLRVRVMAGKDQTIQLRALVDGRWTELGDAAPGLDDYTEVDGTVNGERLAEVEVICKAASPGTMTNGVMWVMTVLPGEPTPWPQPDPAWPGMLRDQIDDFEPTIGLMGDLDAFNRWRERLHQSELADLWRRQVEEAGAALADSPEAHANPITPYTKERFGRPNAPDRAPFGKAISLATVGLIEQRPEMLRLAARWALVWSQCKRWVQYGLEALDGIRHDHGRFAQATAARAMGLLLDRAGCALTEEGQAAVAHAIRHLGVLDIDPIMKPGSYVWNMNQGIVFECGRLLGAIACDPWFPGELARRMDDAEKMLRSVLGKAFSEDGGAEEGPSYWSYTLLYVPEITAQLTRLGGGRPSDYLPPNVAASAKWALTNLRTDIDEPRMLTHGDSGYERPISGDLAAFFAGPLGIPEYRTLARRLFPVSAEPTYLANAQLASAPEAPAGGRPGRPEDEGQPPPILTVFPRIQQVDVRQPKPREGLRIYFLSGDRAGHGHDDRNSFILEAFGQPLLIDRGTPTYTHPATAVCKRTGAHNGIAPDGHTQMADVHEPSATLTDVRETDDGKVIIESDASAAWRDWSVKVVRRLTHVRPDILLVEDLAQWSRPTATCQYWQSLGDWCQLADQTWLTSYEGVELQLQIAGDARPSVSAEPYSVDGNLRPVHRLSVVTPRAESARLVALMQVRESPSQPWPLGPAGLDIAAEALTVERTNGETVEFGQFLTA